MPQGNDVRDDSTAGFSTASREAVPPPAGVHPPPLPALTILGHPELGRIGERVLLGELTAGRGVELSRHQPSFAPPGGGFGRPLADPFLSRRPLRLSAADGGGVRIDRDGSRTHLAVDGEAVAEGCTVAAGAVDGGVVLELARRVVLLLHRATPGDRDRPDDFGLVGESDAMVAVRRAIARVADLDVPVLVRGETGTGKELVARALHRGGPRRDGPFVAVDLGAVPPSLAAAELFGARKGAFTGADRDRAGYFERADGGTLFLDEVGEAPPELQAMLLRVLETGEVTAVGGRTARRPEVRLVAATDADLERRIAAGDFRAQLLHRLAGYTLRLPPLRHRRDDLGRLLIHFLRRERERIGEPPPPADPEGRDPWLPAALVARLVRHRWPGNVRQLRNVVRQLVIDARGRGRLDAGPHLDELLGEPPAGAVPAAPEGASGPGAAAPGARQRGPSRKPSEVPEAELLETLRRERWNLKATARALGIPRTSLYELLRRSPRVRAAADVPAEEIRDAHRRHGGELEAMVTELEISERALRQRLRDLGLR